MALATEDGTGLPELFTVDGFSPLLSPGYDADSVAPPACSFSSILLLMRLIYPIRSAILVLKAR
jgi:hypothetical protein